MVKHTTGSTERILALVLFINNCTCDRALWGGPVLMPVALDQVRNLKNASAFFKLRINPICFSNLIFGIDCAREEIRAVNVGYIYIGCHGNDLNINQRSTKRHTVRAQLSSGGEDGKWTILPICDISPRCRRGPLDRTNIRGICVSTHSHTSLKSLTRSLIYNSINDECHF